MYRSTAPQWTQWTTSRLASTAAMTLNPAQAADSLVFPRALDRDDTTGRVTAYVYYNTCFPLRMGSLDVVSFIGAPLLRP